MQKLSLLVLILWSGTAMATETRMDALSNNVGIADDTDYQIFASQTDEAGDNVWLDYDGSLGGAVSGNGTAVSISSGAFGDAAFGWYNSSGDTGYSVGLDIGATDSLGLNGSYSKSNGDNDMAFSGAVAMAGEAVGVAAGVMSRTLTDSDVSAWGANLMYNDGNIDVAGGYAVGWVMGSDASTAAMTVGPTLGVSMPDGGDMALDISLAAANLAGEFMFNDWVGVRGSVTGSLDIVDPTGELNVATSIGSAMGGTFHSDAGAIDITFAPAQLLGGPYFLTGAGTGAAVAFSARFAI
jgi:hypothetical protein